MLLYFMCFMLELYFCFFFFFSSRRRHTRLQGDWSSDVCSSDLCWWPRRAVCLTTSKPRTPCSTRSSTWCLTRQTDRKSTRLNSSHLVISYAVFCLKKKNLQPPCPAPSPPLQLESHGVHPSRSAL